MLEPMSEGRSFAEIARALVEDPEYRKALTARLQARTVDTETMDRLIAYARSRQTTMGQAMARKVLTDAGVSWESL
jgi:CHASE3 domain sensor protein